MVSPARVAPHSLPPNSTAQRVQNLGSWLPPGSLLELSGSGGARTSMAGSLLQRFQQRGEPVAWVQPEGGGLFPPDLAACGVDLASLLVVQAPRINHGTHDLAMARSCELLLRSGAFGLVVADFAKNPIRYVSQPSSLPAWRLRTRWTTRWAALCRQHASCLLLLSGSHQEENAFGALVGIRAEVGRLRVGPGRFLIDPQLLRAKGCASTRTLCSELRCGPPGLG